MGTEDILPNECATNVKIITQNLGPASFFQGNFVPGLSFLFRDELSPLEKRPDRKEMDRISIHLNCLRQAQEFGYSKNILNERFAGGVGRSVH